jgi:hypothetical protein
MSAAGRRIWPVAQLLGTELPPRLHVGATQRFYITVKTNISARRRAAFGNGREISATVARRRSRVFRRVRVPPHSLIQGAGPRIPERLLGSLPYDHSPAQRPDGRL